MDPFTATTSAAGALQLAYQVGQTLTAGAGVAKTASNYVNTSSLIDITKVARVEPICLVDADVLNIDYLPDVMQSLQSIFSGYYLQAISLTSKIGNVSLASKLAPLNPNRSIFESFKSDFRLSVESYKHRLPTTKNNLAMAMEAKEVEEGASKEANKTMLEMSNLSIGKLYDVTIVDGAQNAKIKVAIRLMASSIPSSVMTSLLSFKDQFDMDMKERYHAWRAGRLSFIKDLVLCRDLIDKHRSALIKDKSNVYAQIVNRENNNFKSGLFNKNPSLATASNLAVVSSDTIAMVEQKIGGKMSNFKTRQQIFDNTNLMIMAVVDKAWERVTWYHRGIQESTTTSIRDIRVSNKGSGGSEVMDIMKAFMAGSSPSI